MLAISFFKTSSDRQSTQLQLSRYKIRQFFFISNIHAVQTIPTFPQPSTPYIHTISLTPSVTYSLNLSFLASYHPPSPRTSTRAPPTSHLHHRPSPSSSSSAIRSVLCTASSCLKSYNFLPNTSLQSSVQRSIISNIVQTLQSS